MEIPPGPLYLLRKILPAFAIPSALVYCGFRALQVWTELAIPTWVVIALSIFARPILFVAGSYYVEHRDRREAAALGACIIPEVESKWPAAFTNVSLTIASIKHGYIGEAFFNWQEKYGNTYQMALPLEHRIFTCEPDHVKAILATQFDRFEKGPISFSIMESLLGAGVFNSDGDMWKFHRTMTRPFFTRERISDFDTFESHAADALSQAKQRLNEGYPIDFQDLVSRFTLDSATQFLFGNDVCSLSAGLPYPSSSPFANSPAFVNHPSNVFVKAFMAGQDLLILRSRYGPSWPLTEFWRDVVRPERRIVDEFVEPLLEVALGRQREKVCEGEKGGRGGKEEEEEAETLLDHLVNHTQDTTILKDELINMLVAGRDTTACTLTFALYMMAEHPEVTRRLREEILAQVGPTGRPTYAHMRDMKYLRAFINEVLRLYPPVPFDNRTSITGTVWPTKTPGAKQFYVPPGVRCVYSVFIMHRRTDLWGPDALKFDPDRFLDERLHRYLTPNPYIFCPFNAGPRICLGQQFAYHESSYFLIRLLQQFSSFSLARDAQPPETLPPASWAGAPGSKGTEKVWPAIHLTMYVKGGLWVRMEEVKAAETSE